VSAFLTELNRLVGLVERFTPSQDKPERLSERETAEFVGAVVTLMHHVLSESRPQEVVLRLLKYQQTIAASQEVMDKNNAITAALRGIATAILNAPEWVNFKDEPNPSGKWVNPWDPQFSVNQSYLGTEEFINTLAQQSYEGNPIDQVSTILAVLTGGASGYNGILLRLMDRDPAIATSLTPFFTAANDAMAELRTLFEFDPRHNGVEAARRLLGIYATQNPQLVGRGELLDRMLMSIWVKEGMPTAKFKELQVYCAQLRYQIQRNFESEQIESNMDRTLLATSTELALASSENGELVLDARHKLNMVWRRKFGLKVDVLKAHERTVGGIYGPVSTLSELWLHIGTLAILAYDAGIDQEVLDKTLSRKLDERAMKHMERVLHEVAGVPEQKAKELMSPIHTLSHLRNGDLPFHAPNDDGRRAFEKIGHPMPIADPTRCWDDICKIYAGGLNTIATALEPPKAHDGLDVPKPEEDTAKA
jgi:hypothetical protein